MHERKCVDDWDEVFMEIAEAISKRSKDPSTQVGACIVGPDKRIQSLGYNGTPTGWEDKEFPWGRDGKYSIETKYPFVIHAERNAILNYRGDLRDFKGSTLYVTHKPCNECMKEIAQVGITKVLYGYFGSDLGSDSDKAADLIANQCGIQLTSLYEQGDPR